MAKNLLITEKPSVATEFAKVLKCGGNRKDGYIESDTWIITWCVGHLVTMSYPEKYDENLKFWRLDTLPFMPKEYKYEVIPSVEKQFNIVKSLLQREDVGCIYVATDSGREGEYIYRLVEKQVGVADKTRKRVWIDSQTEEEINRGIKEAKDLGEEKISISVGRVMTCVLGMVVQREREIRNFVKTPYYRVIGTFGEESSSFTAEWKVTEKSKMWESPKLYNENGFKKENEAKDFIMSLKDKKAIITEVKKSKTKENAPLLFNLAEIQNIIVTKRKIKKNEKV